MAVVPLEREDELVTLTEIVAAAGAGSGGVVLVEAAAGIGKTALLRELRRRAEAAGAVRVLSARGSELESDYPFGIVRQLLDPLLADDENPGAARLLAGAARPAAALFGAHGPQPADAGGGHGHGYDALHALVLVLARLAAERPLLLVADDAQWADEPSLRFLAFLARRAETLPLALAISARPVAEWNAPALYDALLADHTIPLLRPRALSRAATGELLDAALAPDVVSLVFADACHAASGGNPFHLLELTRTIRERRIDPSAANAAEVAELGPAAVRRSLAARLARLPPSAAAFATAAAVLGERAPLALVGELAGLERADARVAAEALRAVGVLDDGPAVRFAHPILLAATRELKDDAGRAAAHARAAALLRAHGAPSAQVAAQLLAAEPAGSAVAAQTLQDAARDASARGAPDVAAVHLRRALAEPPPPARRAELTLELGLAEARQRAPEARDTLMRALELSERPDDRLRAAIALWTSDSFDGRYAEGFRLLEQALRSSAGADPALLIRVELEVARAPRSNRDTAAEGRGRVAALRARVDLERARTSPADRLTFSLMALDGLYTNVPADELAALAERCLPLDDELLARNESQLLHIPLYTLVYCDRLTRAFELLDGLIDDAAARGSMIGVEIGSIWRALAHLRAGALAAAERDAQRVLDSVAESRWRFGGVAARWCLTQILLERGQLDAARALYEPLLRIPGVDGRGWMQEVRHCHARLLFAHGDARASLEELLRVGQQEQQFAATRPAMLPWRSDAALVALVAGEPATARRLAAEEVELARAFGAPRALGVALRARGVVTAGVEGRAALEEAVAVLERSPARLEHARALVDLGRRIAADGDPRGAHGPLRAGLDGALACGATALAERAGAGLAASDAENPSAAAADAR